MMMQDKNTPELPDHIFTRTSGIFSTFHPGFMGRWGAWIVLLASLLITFNAWYFARGEATKRTQARFDFRVKTIETRIYERLQAYEFLLRGGSGLFATSDEVTREDWRTYVTKLQINQYYPGIQGVGFAKRILPSEKAAHLRQIRGEGFPQYTIKPDGERPEYTSIIFIEPFDWRNQRAFGYDMFSEPTRKEAMIRARDTGIAALSGKVTLLQETAKDIQSGFLIYLAVYRKGEPLETQEQRRKALMGYVYSPFRMNDFMKGILLEKEEYFELQIFDGDKPLKETLQYRSDSAEELHNHLEDRNFATHQSILEYAGHRWLLSFVSSKYFEENIVPGLTNFSLLLGITISLLLFGMVLSLTKSRSQAIILANTTLDLEKANIGLRKEITERKRAEESLRKSEEKYRTIFENIQDVYFETSIDGTILEISPSIESASQYKRKELVGKSLYDIYTNPKDRDEFLKLILDKGKVNDYKIYLTDKDGSQRPCSISVLLIRDEQGNPIRLVGSMRDISERELAEKERKRLEFQLLQAQKMEAIGNLAGGIAHDFNNILTSVIGFAELSLDEVEKGTHLEDNLQEIYTAGKRAKDLVSQILVFARQSEEELKPIQVDTIATEVLKLIRSSIPTTIEIKQTIQSDSLIMGNATQVHQILMNLFTNAAHAMEDNGGILEFSLKDVVMDRGVTREKLDLNPGNYIEIKVSDTGAGIAPEIIGFIFDPYFTTKAPGEGTGMGLAMVHGIVKRYGGRISVDSKPGQGTLFTICLPVARKRQEHHLYQSETLPTGAERILFVDDEVPIAKMGGQTLEGLGYTVSIRTSSIEALELFRSKPNDFDLVITDTTMPNMTGDKLVVEMIKIRPDIPVIICSGYSKKISDKNASEIGIRAFASKPFVKADLARTVRKVLDDQQPEQTTGRILVIDDESEIRKLFIKKLAGRGYEIIEACDGKEGIKLCHKTRPDLVITDIVMPEKEGIETITELKREFPDIKIIAISGGGRNAPDAYLQLAKNLGVDRTFSKPIDWPELIKTIRELLQ
jgi:PAS domain S-box-containing protein